jgi:hypothetical protein
MYLPDFWHSFEQYFALPLRPHIINAFTSSVLVFQHINTGVYAQVASVSSPPNSCTKALVHHSHINHRPSLTIPGQEIDIFWGDIDPSGICDCPLQLIPVREMM